MPARVGLPVVSRARRPPLGSIAKEGAAQLFRWRGSLMALAALVEETGPLSRRALVVMQAINALSSLSAPCRPRLCGNREEAACHLGENMGVSAEESLAAIRAVCERYPFPDPSTQGR